MKKNYLNPLLRQLTLLFVLFLGAVAAPAANLNAKGDVNLDGEVNIADVNSVIDVILNGTISQSADVNNDGEINIADVNALIEIILNGVNIDPLLIICENVSEIDYKIQDFYKVSESLDDMKSHESEILAMEGVEYIYYGTNTMFVVIKDFGTISYSHFPLPDEEDVSLMKDMMTKLESNRRYSSPKQSETSSYQDFDDAQVLIVNQQHSDEEREYARQSATWARTFFTQAGFNAAPIENSPDVEFFRNGLFGYDYVFLITHGCYGYDPVKKVGTHWLLSSQEIPYTHSIFTGNHADPEALAEIRKSYGAEDVNVGFVKEVRNGKRNTVAYLMVSEHFINSSTNQFKHPGKGVFFNVACESIEGPNLHVEDSIDTSLADVFISKGVGAYIGYDRSNWGGQVAGLTLLSRLLNGHTIKNAFSGLHEQLLHEHHQDENYWADLELYPKNSDFHNTVINRPVITCEDKSDDSMLQIDLHAGNLFISLINPTGYDEWEHIRDYETLKDRLPFRYGFELSESEQFNDVISLGEKKIGDEGCSDFVYFLDLNQTLTYDGTQPDAKIKPETTYWVRAFAHDTDNHVYNYSEPITFTTGSVKYVPQVETIPVGNTGVSIAMVAVEGGTFMMGATEEQGTDAKNNEKPAHQVTLSDYHIAQFPVTQELWQAVMGSNPSHFTGDLKRPVEYMTWNDCQTFISKLNTMTGRQFRLPTEAEWEFAARGGIHDVVSKYSGSDDPYEVGWFYFNSESTTHPVGQKAPNELGIYDMSGNVYELCQDWYGDYSSAPQTNPKGPANGEYRIMRGGHWGSTAVACRVSYRNGIYPTLVDCTVGFRLAMD